MSSPNNTYLLAGKTLGNHWGLFVDPGGARWNPRGGIAPLDHGRTNTSAASREPCQRRKHGLYYGIKKFKCRKL